MTWVVLALPVVVFGGLAVTRQDGPALLMLLLAVELPFRLWAALGVTMGGRADFYGWPLPGTLGWTLIGLTDLAAWYLVACAIAAVGRTLRRRPAAA